MLRAGSQRGLAPSGCNRKTSKMEKEKNLVVSIDLHLEASVRLIQGGFEKVGE